MNLKRSPWRRFVRNVVSLTVSMSLALTLVPRVPAYAVQEGKESTWADSIGAMSASGSCVEGEAVVALAGSEEDVLTAQAGLPADAVEPLVEVGAHAAADETDGLSTAEMLLTPADDSHMDFAEPNYTDE